MAHSASAAFSAEGFFVLMSLPSSGGARTLALQGAPFMVGKEEEDEKDVIESISWRLIKLSNGKRTAARLLQDGSPQRSVQSSVNNGQPLAPSGMTPPTEPVGQLWGTPSPDFSCWCLLSLSGWVNELMCNVLRTGSAGLRIFEGVPLDEVVRGQMPRQEAAPPRPARGPDPRI